VNREYRFATDVEREEYLRRVPAALAHTDIDALAYCLMSSHPHWATVLKEMLSESFIQPLHSGWAWWVNRHQQKLGPVFAGRHASIMVVPEHTARLIAYIHNNPVRARLVSDPADSSWSSHRAFIGGVRAPGWLNVERALAACGFSSSPSGRLAFHDYVRSRSGEPRDPELSGGEPARTRARIRRLAGAPVEISSPTLEADRLQHEVRVSREGVVRPRWAGSPADVAGIVARLAGICVERMQSRDRSREVTGARRLALLAWTDYLGREQQTMSTFLGLCLSAGSKLLRGYAAIDDLRPEAEMVASVCWEKTQ
jgi:hypothetical protein